MALSGDGFAAPDSFDLATFRNVMPV